MGIFAISFAIGPEGDRERRLASLVQKIETEAVGVPWTGTDSFYVIESDKTGIDLAYFLFRGSDLRSSGDRLLVLDLNTRDYVTHGAIPQPRHLKTLIERCQIVP